MEPKNRVGVVIPTWNAETFLPRCVPALQAAACKPKILVVDSSSTDDTVNIAKKLGIQDIHIIAQTEFDHGGTREMARLLLGTEIVVMVTQDIIPLNGALDALIAPLLEKKAALSYGRQIPHKNATFLEAFPRQFNYSSQSYLCGIEDFPRLGAQLFFCSNAFAAYSFEALDAIGGFSQVLFGEDTVAAAMLTKKNYKIAYVAEAIVHHSHNYSLRQEFHRHFDIGLSRQQKENLLQNSCSDTARGKCYAQQLLKQIIFQQPWLFPYAFCHLAAKWLGYQCGKRSVNAPSWLKKTLSSHPSYFIKN